jgi:dTDP-4-amino-4,6-dideoxygalactose transaminase
MNKSIPVTKSFFPPIEEYMAQIKRAYDNEWLTNRGELVLELEQKLTDYLELHEAMIICMNNGTIPLQIALKLLGRGGEIITTPFSYVASTSTIVWENCTPIFVDIHPDYLTIDELKIEEAINERTTCILATHVFGNPCNIEEIQRIADKHNLKVIYDAAHCFGVKYKGKSIFEYGDISTCSFHATKLFHTGEGGAIFCKDPDLFHKIYYSHNFGHDGPIAFHGLGINGKISELSGAMGLAVLPHMEEIINARRIVVRQYDEVFKNSHQILMNEQQPRSMKIRLNTDWNFSYYPVLFPNEEVLLKSQIRLNAKNIMPRRYFYPSLQKLPYLDKQVLDISEDISKRILCLPLYHNIKLADVELIKTIILNA